MNKTLMTAADVAKTLGISRATMHRWAKAGILPPPVINVRRMRRWNAQDIARLAQRIAQGEKQS